MAMEATLGKNGHATEARATLMDEVLAETERRKKELDPRTVEETWKIAGISAKSGLNGITTNELSYMILHTGKELGLSAMQSLRGLYVIDNKVSIYADTMVALVRNSGKCARWQVVESTRDRCTIEAERVSGEKFSVTWTMEEANGVFLDADRKKPLTGKAVWRNNPRQMLRHRCASELARELFPDVILGMFTPEELDSIPAEEVMRQAREPEAPKPAAATADAPKLLASGEQYIRDYAVRCDKAATEADLKALSDEAKAQAPDVRKAINPLYAKARDRVRGPKGDGPTNGGGAPKPEAQASTEATGTATEAAGGVTADDLVAQWTQRLFGIKEPPHALASIAAHIDEMPAELRKRCLDAGAMRLRAFTSFAGQDVEAIIAEAIAKRAAKAAA